MAKGTPRLGRPRVPSVRGMGRISRLSLAGLPSNARRHFSRRSFGFGGGDSRSRERRDPHGVADVSFLPSDTASDGCGFNICKNCFPFCCCCCCCCLNLEYARSRPGVLRIAQVMLSSICTWLLGSYVLRVAGLLGGAMPVMFFTAAGGSLCCGLLLVAALLSQRTLGLLRASLFELVFHITAVGLYGSHSSYLHVATTIYLAPYKNDADSYTYPASVTAYWLGYMLAALHALDTVYAMKHYRQYRKK